MSLVAIAATLVYLGFEASSKEKPGSDPHANEATALSPQSLAEAEAAHGADSPEVARILSSTVQLLWGREEYAAARTLAERALAIRLKTFGGQHPDVASSLYQIAELRRATGDYAGAMVFHRRALAIWGKTLGMENPEVASSLHYLGMLHLTTGDPAGARALLEKALAIRERALGPMHEQVATTLNALAYLSMQAGDRAEARPLLERTQAIWEHTLGPEHPFVARSLTSRAGLLAEGGDYGGARRLLERALEIRVKALGPGHYLVARSMADIANLLAEAGDNTSAEPLYLQALDIQQRTLSPAHPEVASTLAALARLQWAMGKTAQALESTLRAEAMARDYFRSSARDLTDDEALRYEAIRTSGLDVALSVLAAATPGPADDIPAGEVSTAAVRRIAEEVVRSRAVVLDQVARQHRGARRAEAGESARRQGASGPGLREVLDALPGTSALVAYVHYQNIGRLRKKPTAAYLALLLKPKTETPVAIPLGAAERIDALIAEWQAQVSSDPRLRPRAIGEQIYRDAGTRLREAIWDPLEPALRGSRQVFIVPDGAVNLVSLTTLPAADGRYLAETGPLIHYLSAERDLVLHRVSGAAGKGVLVIGGPDFDAKPKAIASPSPGDPAGDGARGAAPLCSEFATLSFEPLPGSRAEAEEVESLWAQRAGVLRLTGAQADEAAFKKNAPGRRILHLATHAYFLSDRCGSRLEMPELSEGPSIIGDRLLLRSGLALAGANRHGDAREGAGAEDGILTAEEIASLDLSGVEWAVLSACDTGVGKVLAGEGVVGLRRAFEVAGAGTLIMSLWAVDDGATRVWMRKLYEKRLSGLSTAEAVRAAGLEIIEAQRRQGGTTHPYFWGGFVAAGDWR